jgi:hypothetical protein
MEESNNMNKKVIRKIGKTIIVKTNSDFSSKDLAGLKSHTPVANGKHFLVFDSLENSKTAFKTLKSNSSLSVRYAYYRIYFTISNLDETSDYATLKKDHIEWITKSCDVNVLFYKLYKKDDKLIGCGDFTIDTKEDMDKLISKEGIKTYTFGNHTGTFYRYNKKDENHSDS